MCALPVQCGSRSWPLPRVSPAGCRSQLMFLIGITLTIGTSHVMSFFLARKKLRGTCTFFVGMALVMYGWPVVGILVEGFGFMNLFWNFFPIAMSFLSRVPYVGEPAVAAITAVTNALAKIPGVGEHVQGLTQTLPGAGV